FLHDNLIRKYLDSTRKNVSPSSIPEVAESSVIVLTYTDRRFTQSIQHHRYLILAILVFVALTIRFQGIGRMNFWYDEVLLWEYSLTGHPLYTPTEPPLMAWLLYIVMSWARSADAFLLHCLPVVIGSVVVLSAFFLGERASGSARVGLLAALLT